MTEPNLPDVEPLLTRADLAGIYRVPESTIRTWNNEGTIPAGFFIGRHMRWDPNAVREDLERRKDEAEASRQAVTR